MKWVPEYRHPVNTYPVPPNASRKRIVATFEPLPLRLRVLRQTHPAEYGDFSGSAKN